MKKTAVSMMLCGCLLLTGCGFLNREYSDIQPHSATYYESEDRSVLRAESYQDLVNDLLLIVSSGAEKGTIWLYANEETADVDAAMTQACYETQFETPIGAYAVEYITYTRDEDIGTVRVLQVSIDYRRTTAQINSIVHASSIAALSNLLNAAAEKNAEELVLQVGYYRSGQQAEVEEIVKQAQQEQNVTGEWEVNYYPNAEDAEIIEILLHP